MRTPQATPDPESLERGRERATREDGGERVHSIRRHRKGHSWRWSHPQCIEGKLFTARLLGAPLAAVARELRRQLPRRPHRWGNGGERGRVRDQPAAAARAQGAHAGALRAAGDAGATCGGAYACERALKIALRARWGLEATISSTSRLTTGCPWWLQFLAATDALELDGPALTAQGIRLFHPWQ